MSENICIYKPPFSSKGIDNGPQMRYNILKFNGVFSSFTKALSKLQIK